MEDPKFDEWLEQQITLCADVLWGKTSPEDEEVSRYTEGNIRRTIQHLAGCYKKSPVDYSELNYEEIPLDPVKDREDAFRRITAVARILSEKI